MKFTFFFSKNNESMIRKTDADQNTRLAVLEEKVNTLQALVMLNLGLITAVLATLLVKVL